MATKYVALQVEVGLSAVGGSVELEFNALLSMSGHLTLEGGRITFEPGLDARMLGRGPLTIVVSELVGWSRRDGQRRLVLEVGEQEHVFRGVGAQRVWVALMAMRVEHPDATHLPPKIFEESAPDSDTNGLYGIGTRGYGYAGRTALGRVVSFWDEFGSLRSIRTTRRAIAVLGNEEREVVGAGASAFTAALFDRWLDVMPELGRESDHEGGWRIHSARQYDSEVNFGMLSIEEAGLLFEPTGGLPELLAARGEPAAAWVDAGDEMTLRLEANGLSLQLRAQGARRHAASLTGMFASPAWRADALGLKQKALVDDQITMLFGPSAGASLIYRGVSVAHAGRQLLKPSAYEVELEMVLDQPEAPLVPFPCVLELSNARGSFSVRCAAGRFAPRPPQPSDEPGAAPRMDVLLRFRGEVGSINRRDHFRLPVVGKVDRTELVVDGCRREFMDDVGLVNVSRRGCRLSSPVGPDAGTTCQLEVECDGVLIALTGKVINVTAVDDTTWQVGVMYAPDSIDTGARLFLDRQSAFLSRRREGHGA